MAKFIRQSFVDSIIARTDLKALIGSKITFQKEKPSESWACCPFHNEKTPSFHVRHAEQYYHCFGCGAGGNAVRFLMDYSNLSFVEAIEELADFNGVSVEYEENSEYSREESQQKKVRLEIGLDALTAAAAFFQQQLWSDDGRDARKYLAGRGLNKSMLEQYQLGYAPAHGGSLYQFLKDTFEESLLEEIGLIGRSERGIYDWFRGRIIFPIQNIRGQVIAFGARSMDGSEPKYLNSKDSAWFNKRNELYGIYQAKQTRAKSLIVTEGYMDVVKLAQFGIANAVAALGTAVGDTHIAHLKKRAEKVYFCFDGDKAGQEAAKKALHALFTSYDDKLESRFVFMPEQEDPDSLLSKQGKDAFMRCMDASITPSQFLHQILGTANRLHWQPEETAQAAAEASRWLGLLPDGRFKTILQQDLERTLQTAVDAVPAPTEGYLLKTRMPAIRAQMPTSREIRMLAVLARHPHWSMKVSIQTAAAAAKAYPLLADALYFARCGADSQQLQAWIRRQNLSTDAARADKALEMLTEAQRQQELLGGLIQLQKAAAERQARLEKLNAYPH